MIRSTEEEKASQIDTLKSLHEKNSDKAKKNLAELQANAINGGNIFYSLMEAAKYCSLGEITHALFEIGGQYRRSM